MTVSEKNFSAKENLELLFFKYILREGADNRKTAKMLKSQNKSQDFEIINSVHKFELFI